MLEQAQVVLVLEHFDTLAIVQVDEQARSHDHLFARGWARHRWRFARVLHALGGPERHGVALANHFLPVKLDIGIRLTCREDMLRVLPQPPA